MAVLWVVAPCRPVWVYQRVRGLKRQYRPLKRWWTHTGLHGATTQKTDILSKVVDDVLCCCDVLRLTSLWYRVSERSLRPPPRWYMSDYGAAVEWYWRGTNQKARTNLSSTMSITNSTWTDLGANPVLCGEKTFTLALQFKSCLDHTARTGNQFIWFLARQVNVAVTWTCCQCVNGFRLQRYRKRQCKPVPDCTACRTWDPPPRDVTIVDLYDHRTRTAPLLLVD
jgi:hypothetical protein